MAKEAKSGAIRQHNRQKILTAAERAFAEHGFKGTSVQKIADSAGLPKTNVLYYFNSKQKLYIAVLEQILNLWNSAFDTATADHDPAEVLAQYISDKMRLSQTKPEVSKIFALEIINGGQNLTDFFKDDHERWMKGRIDVIQQWIDRGLIQTQDPYYLIFHIWACSQHYADFSSQITHLRGQHMTSDDFSIATKSLIQMILTGCGLDVPTQYKSE
jgi:TetR/AcrR family transcriptional regulator